MRESPKNIVRSNANKNPMKQGTVKWLTENMTKTMLKMALTLYQTIPTFDDPEKEAF